MRRECNVAAIIAASLCQVSGVRYVTVLAMEQRLLSRWGLLISSTMLSPPGGKRHRTIRVNLHNALQWSFSPSSKPLIPPVYHQRLDDHHINSSRWATLLSSFSTRILPQECSTVPLFHCSTVPLFQASRLGKRAASSSSDHEARCRRQGGRMQRWSDADVLTNSKNLKNLLNSNFISSWLNQEMEVVPDLLFRWR